MSISEVVEAPWADRVVVGEAQQSVGSAVPSLWRGTQLNVPRSRLKMV
jgi:hypothetical protein